MNNYEFIIGRAPSVSNNQVAITLLNADPSVSRNHCKVSLFNNKFYIEDLGSKNGTYVDGKQINGPIPISRESKILLAGKVSFFLSHPEIQLRIQSSNNKPGSHTKPPENQNNSILYNKITYASFGSRFLGYIIDAVISGVLCAPLLIISSLLIYISPLIILFVQIACIVSILYFYFVSPISKNGQTIGRKIAGIKYLDQETMKYPSKSKALIRTLSYAISNALFGFGFFMAAWDNKKQALHDKIAGTIAIESK